MKDSPSRSVRRSFGEASDDALLPLLAFSCGLPLALRLRHLAQLALTH